MPDTTVGKRIRMLRESKGLTQKEAADALEMPRSTYVHYEDGSNEPKISVLVKLALYYNISVDWLIGNEPKSESSPPEDKWEALRKSLEMLNDTDLKEVWSFVKFLHWKKSQENQG